MTTILTTLQATPIMVSYYLNRNIDAAIRLKTIAEARE